MQVIYKSNTIRYSEYRAPALVSKMMQRKLPSTFNSVYSQSRQFLHRIFLIIFRWKSYNWVSYCISDFCSIHYCDIILSAWIQLHLRTIKEAILCCFLYIIQTNNVLISKYFPKYFEYFRFKTGFMTTMTHLCIIIEDNLKIEQAHFHGVSFRDSSAPCGDRFNYFPLICIQDENLIYTCMETIFEL